MLIHTGEWPDWHGGPMPNSNGCIHIHPEDCKSLSDILQSHGVQVNPNTNGSLPYPYAPQGLLSLSLRP